MHKFERITPDRQWVEGYFQNWVQKNITHELLEFPIDEYLNPYYTSGLIIKHWSAEDFIGKYFQGMAYAYQYAGHYTKQEGEPATQRLLRNRMDQIVEALMHYQAVPGNNIILKMYREPGDFDEFWRLFTIKYGLLILLTYYELFQDESVLQAAITVGERTLAEYAPETGKPINVEGRTAIEGFVLLYRHTGRKEFLAFCDHIMKSRVQKEFVDDVLANNGALYRIPECHAYTVLSTYLGILDLYNVLEEKPAAYLKACEVAVQDIAEKRLHITGGVSTCEFFQPDGNLGGTPADRIDEACAGAYLMRLCLKLFWVTGELKYIDLLESTFYNSGLGCKNARDPYFVSYYTPLQGNRNWKKTHLTTGTPCCSASMSREIARITDAIWAKNETSLALLLYNTSGIRTDFVSADNNSVPVYAEIQTKFPVEGRAALTIRSEQPVPLTLLLRVPSWCSSYIARIGKEKYIGVPGTFLSIDRLWEGTVHVDIDLDLTVAVLDGGASFPGYKAIRRGPQILCVDQAVCPWIKNLHNLRFEAGKAPVLRPVSSEKLPLGWVGSQIYACDTLSDGALLVPFAEAGQLDAQEWYHTWIREEDGWVTVDDGDLTYSGCGWRKTGCKLDDFMFIPYHGNRPFHWLKEDCIESFYQGTIHYTAQEGDTMEFLFDGTGVELYVCGWSKDYPLGFAACEAELFLDGKSLGTYRFSGHQMQRRLFFTDGLAKGRHTLKAVCKGEALFIDYLRYKP